MKRLRACSSLTRRGEWIRGTEGRLIETILGVNVL